MKLAWAAGSLRFRRGGSPVCGLQWHPDGQSVWVFDRPNPETLGAIRWNFRDGQLQSSCLLHQGTIAATVHPNGRELITMDGNGRCVFRGLDGVSQGSVAYPLVTSPSDVTETLSWTVSAKAKVALFTSPSGPVVSFPLDREGAGRYVSAGGAPLVLSPSGEHFVARENPRRLSAYRWVGERFEPWQSFSIAGTNALLHWCFLGETIVVAGDTAGVLTAVDLRTTETLWSRDVGEPGWTPLAVFALSGKTLLIVLRRGRAQRVRLIDASTGELLRESDQQNAGTAPHSPNVAALSPDGRVLAWVNAHAVHFLDAETLAREPYDLAFGQGGPCAALNATPDGRWLVAGCEEGTIRVFNALEGAEIARLETGGRPISGVDLSLDGRLVLASAEGLRGWEFPDGNEVISLPERTEQLQRLHPDGDRVLLHRARVFSLSERRLLWQHNEETVGDGAHFDATGTRVVVPQRHARVVLRESDTGKRVEVMDAPARWDVQAARYDAGTNSVVALGSRGIFEWTGHHNRTLAERFAGNNLQCPFVLSPDGRWVACLEGGEQQLLVIDRREKLVHARVSFWQLYDSVRALTFLPNGWLVVGTARSAILVFEL